MTLSPQAAQALNLPSLRPSISRYSTYSHHDSLPMVVGECHPAVLIHLLRWVQHIKDRSRVRAAMTNVEAKHKSAAWGKTK